MQLAVLLCSGREVAKLDADPSWRVQDVLAAVPSSSPESAYSRRIFLASAELCGASTLADIGAESGMSLTLVVTRLPLLVASCSDDSTVKIWSTANGDCLHTLEGHRRCVVSAVFSPDGGKLLTASADGTARIWSTAQGQWLCLHTLSLEVLPTDPIDPSDSVVAAFSPDGQRALTASSKRNEVSIWSVASGRRLFKLEGHTYPVLSAAFSPNGKRVVTTSWDWSAMLWSLPTGRNGRGSGQWLHTLAGHEDGVRSAVFSPDGQKVATASVDKTASVWCATSGRWLCTINSIVFTLDGVGRGSHHSDPLVSVVFSPDGKKLLSAAEDTVPNIWSAVSGDIMGSLRGHRGSVYSAVFSPDGKRALTTSDDGTAKIWATGSMRCWITLALYEGTGDWHCVMASAAFSPEGELVLTTARVLRGDPGGAGGAARVWCAASGRLLHALVGHEDPCFACFGRTDVPAAAEPDPMP